MRTLPREGLSARAPPASSLVFTSSHWMVLKCKVNTGSSVCFPDAKQLVCLCPRVYIHRRTRGEFSFHQRDSGVLTVQPPS